MVLIHDGNPEHHAQTRRKIVVFEEIKSDLWLFFIQSNALNRSNNRDFFFLVSYGPISELPSNTVCPGSSDPTLNIESNYFIQFSSCDLKLFCSVNE